MLIDTTNGWLGMTDKPSEDPEAVGDPYKTLFIARLVRFL